MGCNHGRPILQTGSPRSGELGCKAVGHRWSGDLHLGVWPPHVLMSVFSARRGSAPLSHPILPSFTRPDQAALTRRNITGRPHFTEEDSGGLEREGRTRELSRVLTLCKFRAAVFRVASLGLSSKCH